MIDQEKQAELEREFTAAGEHESHYLKHMEVGEYTEMDRKHQIYVHVYASKSKKKFATKSINSRLIVKRLK